MKHILTVTVAGAALAAGLQLPIRAQAPSRSPEVDALKGLTFRSLGPTNQAGRVSVIVGVPGKPTDFYVSGANGGVFKTTNGGTTWKALFDDQNVLSIGAIELAPSNPDIVYVGTGEGNPRNNASFGNGMYRSSDGGLTWTHIGLEDSDRIARIRVDNRNPDVVYACALGKEWGPHEQRGVFKSTDGGTSWKKVLYRDDSTGCSDIDVNPTNSNEVYAGMYTFRRQPFHLRSGGGETALYKSTDGGTTWKKLTDGIPAMLDRIGVAVSRSEPDTVYMISETPNYAGELWRSDDAGGSWRVVNKDPQLSFRPFYYADIRVDPRDSNRIYALGGALWMSDDGGRSFQRIANDVHGDHQALWIDPTDPRRVLSGSDGGFQVSYDRGENFTILNNIPFTQFYHVNYDMQTPYMVCGGLQDNGTWCGPSNSLRGQGIRERDWYNVGGGDGFFAVPDLKEPWRVYTDLQGGAISVMDVRSGTSRSIEPYPNRIGSVGDAMANHTHRFNWNSPIALGPDGTTVYFGGEVLFKSTNHGQSWDIISPDLTTNDKSKQQDSGGPIVIDNTAAEFYCTILTIAPSMLDPKLVWVGTDDGNVQVTRDGGKSWTNVAGNIPGLAPNAWIPTVDASTREPGTAYVAADHHQDNDYSAYFYKTTDYGKSWTKLSLGLPAAKTGWAHVIREDPRNSSVLYAGTELGLWISFDGGAHWASFRQNMPSAPVRDLLIHPRDNDLIVATHGRGLFIMDDISPVQHIADAIKTDAQLFDVQPATRWTVWNNDGNLGQAEWTADNPQQGAVIDYYLKGGGRPVITITDKAGNVVRTIRNVPRTAGVNRATWDLRYDPPAAADGGRGERGAGDTGGPDSETPARGRGRGGRGGGAPLVLPGQYTVTLNAGGQKQSKPITVGMDPRVPVSSADLQAQLDAVRTLGDMNLRMTSVLSRANSLIDQLAALQERLKSNPSSQLREAENSINKALEAITKYRDEVLTRPYPSMGYRQYPRLREEIGSLSGAVSRAPFPPTAGQAQRMKELAAELGDAVNTLNTMQTNQIENINAMLKGMPAITTGIIK